MSLIKKKIAAKIMILYVLKRKQKKRKSKRKWVSDWLMRRESENVTKKLLFELQNNDSDLFNNYSRISPQQFDFILKNITVRTQKQSTNMRRPIDPNLQLIITLRFLATGESFRSLSYQFRVGISTIAHLVLRNCEAIFDFLKTDFLMVNIDTKKH